MNKLERTPSLLVPYNKTGQFTSVLGVPLVKKSLFFSVEVILLQRTNENTEVGRTLSLPDVKSKIYIVGRTRTLLILTV